LTTQKAVSLRSICPDVQGTTYATHCIHTFYPARFIPQVPRYVLERYPVSRRPALVFDPFAGAGTTAVEAYLQGHHSWTIDVNPLTAFLVRVKLQPLSPRLWPQVWHTVLDHVARMRRSHEDWTPAWEDLHYWFPAEALPFLRRMWGYLKQLPTSEPSALFLQAAALAVTRYFSWGDSRVPKLFKSKRRKAELPRILDELARNPSLPWILLQETARRYIYGAVVLGRMAQNREVCVIEGPPLEPLSSDRLWAYVQCADARQVGPILRQGVELTGLIDYIITSPPYCYAQEYFRSTKIDLYWLGLVDSATLRQMMKDEIGYTTADPMTFAYLQRQFPALRHFLEKLESDVSRRRAITQLKGYFVDLWRVLEQAIPYLRPGGWCAIFVGEPRVLGHTAPLHRIIAEYLEALGLEVRDQLLDTIRARNLFRGRRNLNPEGIQGEWLIVAQKPDRLG
jgi:hypothetical protein